MDELLYWKLINDFKFKEAKSELNNLHTVRPKQ